MDLERKRTKRERRRAEFGSYVEKSQVRDFVFVFVLAKKFYQIVWKAFQVKSDLSDHSCLWVSFEEKTD